MTVSLEFLQSRVRELDAWNEKLVTCIHLARDDAFKLLDAIDASRPEYKPIPWEDVVQLARGIVSELSD